LPGDFFRATRPATKLTRYFFFDVFFVVFLAAFLAFFAIIQITSVSVLQILLSSIGSSIVFHAIREDFD